MNIVPIGTARHIFSQVRLYYYIMVVLKTQKEILQCFYNGDLVSLAQLSCNMKKSLTKWDLTP